MLRARRKGFGIVFEIALFGALIWLGWAIKSPIASIAREEPDCASDEANPENLLACVRRLIEAKGESASVAQAVLQEPLANYLKRLAEAQVYQGATNDLDVLKQHSKELKRDPLINRSAIAVLDNAIASHVNEIRPALSTRALAESSAPGNDIYPQFIKQKLGFLGSEQASFYDRGPFEISRRSLLASSLESEYFLKQESGAADENTLRRAIRLVDDVLDRLTGPEYEYLRQPGQSQRSSINSNQFWRASLYLVLGELSETRDILRKLVIDNKTFSLETSNPGHVYIYRPFNFPHRIIVQGRGAEQGGAARAEIRDQWVLNRYYNPAQLALYSCGQLNQPNKNRIANFTRAIGNLVLSDYYVVLASGDSATALREFESAVGRIMQSEGLREGRERLLKNLAGHEMVGFSKAIAEGAQSCGIDDATREEIFTAFKFQSSAIHIEGLGQQPTEYLLLGGRLNASQANVVADFVNKSVIPEVPKPLQERLGIKAHAYTARMKID
jgi:hypothetical protein